MKNTVKLLLILCFTLIICVSVLTACNSDDITLTKSQIENALSSSSGTLSTQGSDDDVTSFTYVMTNVNAKNLSDKSYVRSAVDTLMSNPSKLTFGEYKVTGPFSAILNIDGLFMGDDGDFDPDAYTDEVLAVICDGSTKRHGNWSISATINSTDDSITITVTSK